ncbi:MAG: hypothetical protein KDB58_05000 [Solirubrobacterales bacterium]|nr:hypothetical protein [Solirubrobacterales bacterium]MCB8969212.1 hypothetical protein [Thermoleophilales bacterium]MCO5328225.1 hypothetical protein [Solirubrobacterales bacterium]
MSRLLRAELLLPVVIVSAAAMVAISEFMTTFEFTSGGEPQVVSTASDRHSFALLILAVLTVAAMVYAIVTGLRAVAFATAVLGCAALLLFVVLDLPDAGKAGPLSEDQTLYFADARADPGTGFWLEAVGTVILGLATVGFATQSSSQLRAPAELIASRRRRREEEAEDEGEADEAGPEGDITGDSGEEEDAATEADGEGPDREEAVARGRRRARATSASASATSSPSSRSRR